MGITDSPQAELSDANARNRTWVVLQVPLPADADSTHYAQELCELLEPQADLLAVCSVPPTGMQPAKIMVLARNITRRSITLPVPFTTWGLPAVAGAVASRSQVQEFFSSLTRAATSTLANFTVRDTPQQSADADQPSIEDADTVFDMVQAEWSTISEADIRKQVVHARMVTAKKRTLRQRVIVSGHTEIMRNIKEAKAWHSALSHVGLRDCGANIFNPSCGTEGLWY